jgi:type IV conjugative transfer system protein TraL
MNNDEFRIPRYLDEPELFPIWTKGESVLVLAPVLFGYLLWRGMGLLVGLVIGVTLLKSAKNFTLKHGRHWFLRLCYWYLPRRFLVYNLYRALPSSHIREYIG